MKVSNPELVGKGSSSTKDLEPDSDEQPPSTLEEVTQTIERLKNHRSPGSDNISSKPINEGGQDRICRMHKVMKEVWYTERMPKDWEKGIMCPIYIKKGIK